MLRSTLLSSCTQMQIQHREAFRTDNLMLRRDVPNALYTCYQAALQLATTLSLEQLGLTYVQVFHM